jgi:hypothetical protein
MLAHIDDSRSPMRCYGTLGTRGRMNIRITNLLIAERPIDAVRRESRDFIPHPISTVS